MKSLSLRKKIVGANVVTVLLVVLLIMLLIGAMPVWPHAASWGYYPFGGFGLILLVILILVLMGKL